MSTWSLLYAILPEILHVIKAQPFMSEIETQQDGCEVSQVLPELQVMP